MNVSMMTEKKAAIGKAAIVLGIVCVVLAGSLVWTITNYNSIISSLNSQIDFLNSQIDFLQRKIAAESFPPLPTTDSACFIYSLHEYGSRSSWYDTYKSWGCAFFKTRSSENVPTSDMIFAENKKAMYYYTAISSDFVSYDGKDLYLDKNLDQVKNALDRSWCAGLYIHELVTYLASINGWNWNIAMDRTDWDYVNDCVHEAWQRGKKVLWSEPSYAWQTVYERGTADGWFNQTDWKESLVITFATNFPTQVWSSSEYAYAMASRFQNLMGESIQDWYFLDQGITPNPTETEWLGRMGWNCRARYFEVEGSDMNPSNAFMSGINSLVLSYGTDRASPNLALSYSSTDDTKNVGSQTFFAISANDESGILAAMYRIDSGGWQEYTGPFTLAGYGDGAHAINCVAVDSVGNIAELTDQVNLDTSL